MNESPTSSKSACEAWSYRKLTPMLRQYVDAKAQCPKDCILMFRMGDFFELFFEDAKIAARELQITLTARDKGDNPIPMAGVPHHAISGYIAKLVERGFSVAMCNQVEDPKLAKGIVRREITRLITPGTATDLEALAAQQASYLGCAQVCADDTGRAALALMDLLAGQLLCTTVRIEALADEAARMGAREILLDACLHAACAPRLQQQHIAVRQLTAEQQTDNAAALIAQRVGTEVLLGLEPVGHGAAGQKTHSVHALHLGCLQKALAAVIIFAESTQRCALTHLAQPRVYDMARYLVLDETTRRNLELTKNSHDQKRSGTLLWHLDRCKTSMGSRQLAQWLLFPLRDLHAINRRADAVGYFKQARQKRAAVQTLLSQVNDIERLAGRVALGRASPRDYGAILTSLRQIPHLRDSLLADTDESQAAFVKTWQQLDALEDLNSALSDALADELPISPSEGGIFRRGYTAELDTLIVLCTESHAFLTELETRERARTQITTLKVRYTRVFGYFIEVSRASAKQVPADYVRKQTLVNAERYITAELKSFEEQVLDADARRRALELSMFEALDVVMRAALHRLRRLSKIIAQTDALIALGEVAETGRYSRPEMSTSQVLTLQQGRHPVLERLMPNGERFVPNDLRLDAQKRQLMVVTGPNMAGKSTAMRQAALCVIMAQMGGFVPAERAKIGLCDRIFTRVGAADDLGRGHSTFMVEMVETGDILRHATSQSLVLLDEIGRGTSTFDGVSIAWAVAEYLHDTIGCRAMFATHYHELCALADSHARIFNASVAIKQQGERIVFLRHLIDGGASRSFGLQVARLAHLPDEVLRRAAVILQGLEAERPQTQGRTICADGLAPAPESKTTSPAPQAPGGPLPQTSEPPANVSQMSLFCPPTAVLSDPLQHTPASRRIERALARYDVQNMTPMQAITALARLQQML